MFKVEHLHLFRSGQRILEDITFDIAPGEVVALVGNNGAGKTTLLKVLATIMTQDEGRVTLDGVNPLTRPLRYRKRIGYLSALCPLYNEMRVRDYLLFRARLKGERTMRLRRRVREALDRFGLREVARTPIQRLSSGFRKRLSLAEALFLRPPLLLLDDLLTGLDAGQQQVVGTMMGKLSANAAILATGHELSELLTWSTRCIVMADGRIVASFVNREYSPHDLVNIVEGLLISKAVEEVEV